MSKFGPLTHPLQTYWSKTGVLFKAPIRDLKSALAKSSRCPGLWWNSFKALNYIKIVQALQESPPRSSAFTVTGRGPYLGAPRRFLRYNLPRCPLPSPRLSNQRALVEPLFIFLRKIHEKREKPQKGAFWDPPGGAALTPQKPPFPCYIGVPKRGPKSPFFATPQNPSFYDFFHVFHQIFIYFNIFNNYWLLYIISLM